MTSNNPTISLWYNMDVKELINFRPKMVDLRRSRGLGVDREHEHGAGREQEVVSHVRRNHRLAANDESHL